MVAERGPGARSAGHMDPSSLTRQCPQHPATGTSVMSWDKQPGTAIGEVRAKPLHHERAGCKSSLAPAQSYTPTNDPRLQKTKWAQAHTTTHINPRKNWLRIPPTTPKFPRHHRASVWWIPTAYVHHTFGQCWSFGGLDKAVAAYTTA